MQGMTLTRWTWRHRRRRSMHRHAAIPVQVGIAPVGHMGAARHPTARQERPHEMYHSGDTVLATVLATVTVTLPRPSGRLDDR